MPVLLLVHPFSHASSPVVVHRTMSGPTTPPPSPQTMAVTATWNSFAFWILPLMATRVGIMAVDYLLVLSDQPALIAINTMIGLGLVMAVEMALTDYFKNNDGIISVRENAVLLLLMTLKMLLGFMIPTVFYEMIKADLLSSPQPTVLQLLVIAVVVLMLTVTYTGFIARALFQSWIDATTAPVPPPAKPSNG